MRRNLTQKAEKVSKKTKSRMWTNTRNWKGKKRKNEKGEGVVNARKVAVKGR
jgi:hypothetical protein